MRPGLRFAVLTRDNYTCRYCGAKAPDVVLHVDHVLPKAHGGRDTLDNLVTACQSCNLGKHASLTEQAAPDIEVSEFWRRYREQEQEAVSDFRRSISETVNDWADFLGRRPSAREHIALGDLLLIYGYFAVYRVLKRMAEHDEFREGEPCEHAVTFEDHTEDCSDFADFTVFDVRTKLRSWRRDGFL